MRTHSPSGDPSMLQSLAQRATITVPSRSPNGPSMGVRYRPMDSANMAAVFVTGVALGNIAVDSVVSLLQRVRARPQG